MSVSPTASEHSPAADQARWFAEEVQPHEAALRAYLHRNFPAMQDVDDLVQDSYLRLLQRQSEGKIASAKAYLFAIARNGALKIFRKRRIFSDVPVSELSDWRILGGEANAADTADLHQRHARVAQAIAALPGRCREIFKLRAVQGLSYAEIGARLGLSEATVRVQIARGVIKCADYLREHGTLHDR